MVIRKQLLDQCDYCNYFISRLRTDTNPDRWALARKPQSHGTTDIFTGCHECEVSKEYEKFWLSKWRCPTLFTFDNRLIMYFWNVFIEYCRRVKALIIVLNNVLSLSFMGDIINVHVKKNWCHNMKLGATQHNNYTSILTMQCIYICLYKIVSSEIDRYPKLIQCMWNGLCTFK